jgi:hypothetical protein
MTPGGCLFLFMKRAMCNIYIYIYIGVNGRHQEVVCMVPLTILANIFHVYRGGQL